MARRAIAPCETNSSGAALGRAASQDTHPGQVVEAGEQVVEDADQLRGGAAACQGCGEVEHNVIADSVEALQGVTSFRGRQGVQNGSDKNRPCSLSKNELPLQMF